MQIVQTKNDIMRIIFNPLLEKYYLGDFLIVTDDFHALVAQVSEVESNEMDSSLNYLAAHFIFTIEKDGEISDYNGYTPGREADVRKVARKEILRIINKNQKTLPLGRIVNSNTRMDITQKFFVNLCAIFSDKIQSAQTFTSYLADKLCVRKPVVIFDFTGSEQMEGARRITAAKDFKMPLNSKTIDYVYEKGLSRANIEAQALIEEIFRELKKYSDSTSEKFIPFAAFSNVVETQYKHTPLPELTVLKNRLQNFQNDSVFASSTGDFKNINRIISNNEITIVDFSPLSLNWLKEFCDFVIGEIKTDCYLFLRLSENNSDLQLIKNLYENKNIIPVPIMTYGYKYASNIKVFLNNYVMFKPLVKRPDFPYYTAFLSRISNKEYIVWGEQTDNAAFIVRNEKYVISDNEESSDATAQTIANAPRQSVQNTQSKVAAIEEEIVFKQMPVEKIVLQPSEPELTVQKAAQEFTTNAPEDNEFTIEITPMHSEIKVEEKETEDIKEETEPKKKRGRPKKKPEIAEVQPAAAPKKRGRPKKIKESDTPSIDTVVETVETLEPAQKLEDEKSDTPVLKLITNEQSQTEDEDFPLELSQNDTSELESEPIEIIEEAEENEEFLSEDDLEFFEVLNADDSQILTENAKSEEQTVLTVQQPKRPESDVFIFEDVDKKVEDFISSEETLNNTAVQTSGSQTDFSENMPAEEISFEPYENSNAELPVFPVETPQNEQEFKKNDRVKHTKFGIGTVQKVVNYADKTLLSIQFETVGKRLLDPALAQIEVI